LSRHLARAAVYAILQLDVAGRTSLTEAPQSVATVIKASLPFGFVNLRRRPIGLGAGIEEHSEDAAFTQGLREIPSDNLNGRAVIADQHRDGTLYSNNS
jgi:hypothetical protein